VGADRHFIDNGSRDGTGAYLAGVQDTSPVPVTVIANAVNRGFPAAVNQGLSVARGEYLLMLNNDAVVTDCWLDQLVAPAEMKTDLTTENTEITEREGTTNLTNLTNRTMRIGVVGPMSNYASPPQLVEGVPYNELEEMHGFARRWREEHRGQWFTTGKLSGFCLLVKRAVYEMVGGLDGRFGLGLFDDDNLAVRASRAGFELAVAHDLFIHHFGSRTFQGTGIDAEKLLGENGRRFSEKWGMAPIGQSVSLRPWPESGNGPQMTQMDADPEKKSSGDSQSGHLALPRSASPSFHLRSSAKSADKSSPASVSLTSIVRVRRGQLL
jgi:GT2 family glycosyltransferase